MNACVVIVFFMLSTPDGHISTTSATARFENYPACEEFCEVAQKEHKFYSRLSMLGMKEYSWCRVTLDAPRRR